MSNARLIRSAHAQCRETGAAAESSFPFAEALAPTGEEISSYVTLRTYSEATHRWEMSGLAAFQPATVAQWYGEWKDGEMRIAAIGKDLNGNPIRNRIRFFLIEKNRFSWESNLSLDDGKTWIRASSLTATRAIRNQASARCPQ